MLKMVPGLFFTPIENQIKEFFKIRKNKTHPSDSTIFFFVVITSWGEEIIGSFTTVITLTISPVVIFSQIWELS